MILVARALFMTLDSGCEVLHEESCATAEHCHPVQGMPIYMGMLTLAFDWEVHT